MKKQIKQTISFMLVAIMCSAGTAATYAATANEQEITTVSINNSGRISPYFLAISNCSRLLRLESSYGKMFCSADTAVYDGYKAEVVVELQKNGTTIKTWRDKPQSTFATVDEYYYVEHGTYQLKVTHRAYTSSGSIADSFVAYSVEVTY